MFTTWTPPDAATEKRHRLSLAQISDIESDTEYGDHSSRHADDHSQEVVQRGEGVNSNNSVSDQSSSKVTSAPTTVQSESTASSRISNTYTGPLSPGPSTSTVNNRFVTMRKSTKPSDPITVSKKVEGLCCPKDFKPLGFATKDKSTIGKGKENKLPNPYTKSNFSTICLPCFPHLTVIFNEQNVKKKLILHF